jgi:hypothetical protein
MASMLKNHFDFLVLMPIGHKKFIVFMIPPMVTNCTVIMVVFFVILVNKHEINVKQVGLRHIIFNIDAIKLNNLLTTLFVSIEHATTPWFVQLTNTLAHFLKMHYLIVDKTHLLLLDFIPIIK